MRIFLAICMFLKIFFGWPALMGCGLYWQTAILIANKPSSCDQCSSVSLCIHDYKSLYVVVMICATQVNTQTDQCWLAIVLAQQLSQIS